MSFVIPVTHLDLSLPTRRPLCAVFVVCVRGSVRADRRVIHAPLEHTSGARERAVVLGRPGAVQGRLGTVGGPRGLLEDPLDRWGATCQAREPSGGLPEAS